jgi:hypothetical protein
VAAAALLLDGRASDAAVRTKNATIAGLGTKQRLAAGAFIKILAGIDGHDFLALMAARGAGDDRLQQDFAHVWRARKEKMLLD